MPARLPTGCQTADRAATASNMRMLSLSALLAAVTMSAGACAEPGAEAFAVEGRIYSVPSDHLRSSSRDPHLFVRIKHPDRPYDLVYDARSARAHQWPGVPRLFSINEENPSAVEYRRGPGGTIGCRKATPPKGGCGLRVEHRGVEWTLLFPIARVDEAEAFHRDAVALLDQYSS